MHEVSSLWQEVQKSITELEENDDPGLGYSKAHPWIRIAVRTFSFCYIILSFCQIFDNLTDMTNVCQHFNTRLFFSVSQLKNLSEQCRNLRKEKQKKVETFILELRHEIRDIWDQCMLSEEDRETFDEYQSSVFSEETLETHKRELQKWKLYLQKTQIVVEKVG